MYSAKTKEQFVELRAQGLSFIAISEQLKVSKPTLIDWSREMSEQIANLRAINDEALRVRYLATKEHQMRIISKQFQAVEKELEKRGLSDLPTYKLLEAIIKLSDTMKSEDKPLVLQHREEGLVLDLKGEKIEWEA